MKIIKPTAQMLKSKKRKRGQKDESLKPKTRFQEKDPFSDLTLVVEDQKLYVHRTLLMLHSPVFQEMLTGDFKENSSSEISLPGKKFSTVVRLLEQIYPRHATYLIKDETLVDVLKLADEYDIQQVFTNTLHDMSAKLQSKYDNIAMRDKMIPKTYRDRIICYLGLVERYPQLKNSPLRERLVKQVSLIPSDQIRRNRYFLSVPTTATEAAFMMQVTEVPV